MKNLIILILLFAGITACSDSKGTLTVNGNIKGLKQGTVYLQKLVDTTIVNVDSIKIDGEPVFKLTTPLENPEILYLYLDIKDGVKYDDRIQFFAEDTIINIETNLEKFEDNAQITGSKNQDILNIYETNKKPLNQVYTKLVQRSMQLNAMEDVSQEKIDSLTTAYDKYLRKKVLYAINYAQLHKDYEVSPYILVKDAFDAKAELLDSAYQMMPKKIQTSRYGKQLSELIKTNKEL
ncbi:hypothetical protein AAT17_09680 [Nonlabens sp. MIC269]|uniref:DUF4369 domain-containing protein n=1 Tax=Nonlabens sp. MIC269 TaxID=1476901 RepID=UPI0007219A27|nr:DUF4369 domain-containing protein [Nonlabens sp. MIC269]ALM21480.1 hypothetical protein AAT17_09680 [Nonlabens sp. MIC269]